VLVLAQLHFIVAYKCIDAILDLEDLADKFPDIANELDGAAQCYASLSSQVEIKGGVTFLDGFSLQIQVLQGERQEMLRHIFQAIIKHME
jgi:hypothetical protein